MTFQDIKDHIEPLGCTLDHLSEEAHFASNCINAHVCVIEDLDSYADVTLCHYFYELGVSPPIYLREEFEKYREMREDLVEKLKTIERDHQ